MTQVCIIGLDLAKNGLRDSSSVIATASMVRYSNGVFGRWEFVTDHPRHDRDGGMGLRNG
jgi:hypothetical protein